MLIHKGLQTRHNKVEVSAKRSTGRGQVFCDVIYGQPPSRDSRNGDYLPNPKKKFCVNFDDVVCSKKNHSQNVRDVQKQLILIKKQLHFCEFSTIFYFIFYVHC